MLFKDLKVGDTLYVKNPKQWDKPIKKTIGKILPYGTIRRWIEFYDENGEYIGDAFAERSQTGGSGIFADFDAFKKYWTDYHTKNVEHLQDEKQKVTEALGDAIDDLVKASLMEDED